MRQTIHLFIGDDLTPVCEAVAKHSKLFGTREQNEYTHFVCCTRTDDICTLRIIGDADSKQQITNEAEAIHYFDNMYGKTITIGHPGDTTYLLVTVYVRLYDKDEISTCLQVLRRICASSKPYEINIIGLGSELADLFCTIESERKELLDKSEQLKKNTKLSINELVALKKEINEDNYKIQRIFFIEKSNEKGQGLDLDKNTLIKILGEYSILVTESCMYIFPLAATPSDEVTLIGISSLWFNQLFFQDVLRRRAFIYLLEREKVDEKSMGEPLAILNEASNLIDGNTRIVNNFINTEVKPYCVIGGKDVTVESIHKFDGRLDALSSTFKGILEAPNSSIPEKRALIAMLVREGDPLFDDNILLKELPTIDDCMSDAIDLYVKANNDMEEPILDGPRRNEIVYNPIDDLKKKLAEIRESQSFIRKSTQRLEDIKKSLKVEEDSQKLLTEQGFTFGGTTYKLEHNVVETPFEKTYESKEVNVDKVDLRADFSPIRNQGGMGACSSFATSSMFEFIINEAKDGAEEIKLSPRFLYYNVCKKNADGTPIDNGSSLYDNVKSLGVNGICEEKLCKYSDIFSDAPSNEAEEDAKTRLITEAKNVNITHKDLTSALAEGYPVGVSLKVYDSFGKGRKGFIFRPSDAELQGTDFGYHAMVLCGFSEANKVYIARNSWGTDFGDKGYCYIPFSYVEDSELCRKAFIITGVSCTDIKLTKVFADPDIRLDSNDKDIEYSVLRIKIEEERVHLKHLEDEYEELYKDYSILVTDLTNKGKREKITADAVSKVSNPMAAASSTFEPSAAVNDMNDNGKIKPGVIVAIVFAILALASIFLYWNKFLLLAFVCVTIMALVFSLVNNKDNKPNESQSKENCHGTTPELLTDNKKVEEIKYILSGLLIDRVKQLHDDFVIKHRYMVSYCRNLQQWLGEEKKIMEEANDGIKEPFVSLFDKKAFDSYFDNNKDILIGNIWLYKEFDTYNLSENDIKDFKDRLMNRLQQSINSSFVNFSMFKYLLNPNGFPYLPCKTGKEIKVCLDKVEAMSCPFAHITGMPDASINKYILLKLADNNEKTAWNNFMTNYYSVPPSTGTINSPVKLIYVQIHEINTSDLTIMQ